MNLGKTQENS